MILHELKKDIQVALSRYFSQFQSFNELSPERQSDVLRIRTILSSEDPIFVFENLTNYVERLNLPLISWLTFIDINNFYWTLKSILEKEKYQEKNFYKQLFQEAKMALLSGRAEPVEGRSAKESVEAKLSMITDMKLLHAENIYLYDTVKKLHDRVIDLEKENQLYLQRAQQAEKRLSRDEPPHLNTVTLREASYLGYAPNRMNCKKLT